MRYLRNAVRGVIGIALAAIAVWTLVSFLPLPDGLWYGPISNEGSAFELGLQALLALVVVGWCAVGILNVWPQAGRRPRRVSFRFAQCASFLLLALLFATALYQEIIMSVSMSASLDLSIWQNVATIIFSGAFAFFWLMLASIYCVWLLKAARCLSNALRGYPEYSAVVTIDGSKLSGRVTLGVSIFLISLPVFLDFFALVL